VEERKVTVCVAVMGGLGNQLFQYASARALADSWDVDLEIDTSRVGGDAPGTRFRLSSFAARFKLTDRRLKAVTGPPPSAAQRFVRTIRRTRTQITEASPSQPDGRLMAARPPVDLFGYWQSPRFFARSEQALRDDLKLSAPLPDRVARLARMAERTSAIAVHFRRGDYLDPGVRRVLHLLHPGYQVAALGRIASQTGSSTVMLFSDDPDWASQQIAGDFEVIVVPRFDPMDDVMTLQVMRSCRHHVIANSSFSWWGAWLADGPEQRVIAPGSWFVDPTWRPETLIPSSWEILPAEPEPLRVAEGDANARPGSGSHG
jgi:hypothetical protein